MNEPGDSAVLAPRHVLVIEDDGAIGRLVKLVLEGAGFQVSLSHEAETGLSIAREQSPAVVLLDLTLPDSTGVETLVTMVRECTAPVIVMTAAHSPETLLECVQAGAFDVALKPFDPDDLEASVKLAVREDVPHTTTLPVVRAGTMQVDFPSYRLTNRFERPDQSLHLSLTEWRLLETLASRPGQTVLSQELLGRVWGASFRGHLELLDVWMERLHKKVGLSEFHGVGYALIV